AAALPSATLFRSRAALGTMQQTGGLVVLRGTLNNRGATLALDGPNQLWRLDGGTILGGTVTMTGGARLIASFFAGRLDAVTVNGIVDVGEGALRVTNGLMLNGTLTVGDPNSFRSGRITFEGTQTLAGT